MNKSERARIAAKCMWAKLTKEERSKINKERSHKRKKIAPIERMLAKVIKGENGCWEFKGANVRGRGMLGLPGKKSTYASRISYEHFKGPIPKGLFVCHSCDNPSCVNPEHLWTGTNADNMQDMIKKGRGNKAKGEKNGFAILTADLVREILNLREKGWTQQKIADRIGISQVRVSQILNGKGWKHLRND